MAKEYLSNLLDETCSQLRKQQIGYTGLAIDSKLNNPSLIFTFETLKMPKKATKLLKKLIMILKLSKKIENCCDNQPRGFRKKNKSIIEQSIEVVRRRVDESGTKEPIIQRQGTDRIIVQLPGIGKILLRLKD